MHGHHRAHPAARPGPAALALVVALLLGALAGCASGGSGTGTKGYVSGDGAITTFAPADRKPAPDLSGRTLDGGHLSLSALHGKPVVVNVWATWCPPCRAEADDLVEAARRLGSRVSFVGINVRDQDAAARAFLRVRHIRYPSIVDESGDTLLGFYGLVNLQSLPSTFVLDAKGRIAAVITGPVSSITLVDLVRQAAGRT